ncbi:DEAD box protein (nucleomorph) [Cryptomonas paramecium]|uniref:DEAD box protein n=1 Tax=Cryptomonas paramaecium TaxID=2898 RepID=F2HI86_9CRYP|nr:DEAD box protein [Cryptomonas paramecium]AEA39010.1 DEAD box protein [Cryptomonas paramecium]|mmetsp:Transcript_36645/g.96591  ORF Transcript_36645/g.96591 Transcript_36645/m.96591 type:complete len:397 (+) Transcript_36645:13238-14428(+)
MIRFKHLGVCEQIVRICDSVGFKYATKIQAKTIPYALKNRDILGYAQTGSGKTLAFVIPILQSLLKFQITFYSFVIVPSRELAFQVASYIETIGYLFGIKIGLLTSGIEYATQISIIKRSPHMMICTPGRLIEYTEKTDNLFLKNIKKIVFDEADRLFQNDFDKKFLSVVENLPKFKQSFLFSATMTINIEKLKKISMSNPVKIKINKKYKTVSTLVQNYIFMPFKSKNCYLSYICNEFSDCLAIIFVDTQICAEKIAVLLKVLNFKVAYFHGKLSQDKRAKILHDFKLKKIKILVSTDLASRGIDIPDIELIINYDIPLYTRDYIHRIGRTARAGKTGRVINLVTQYDISSYQKIEILLQRKLEEFKCNLKDILFISKRVSSVKLKINYILRHKL